MARAFLLILSLCATVPFLLTRTPLHGCTRTLLASACQHNAVTKVCCESVWLHPSIFSLRPCIYMSATYWRENYRTCFISRLWWKYMVNHNHKSNGETLVKACIYVYVECMSDQWTGEDNSVFIIIFPYPLSYTLWSRLSCCTDAEKVKCLLFAWHSYSPALPIPILLTYKSHPVCVYCQA